MRDEDTKILVSYCGSLPDGTIFDDNRDSKPLEVKLGANKVPPGIEKALREMETGEERTIVLPPEEAYGYRKPEAIIEMPVFAVPHSDKLEVGQSVIMRSDRADWPACAEVIAIENGVITMDFNHPLADQTLTYWLKVVSEIE